MILYRLHIKRKNLIKRSKELNNKIEEANIRVEAYLRAEEKK